MYSAFYAVSAAFFAAAFATYGMFVRADSKSVRMSPNIERRYTRVGWTLAGVGAVLLVAAFFVHYDDHAKTDAAAVRTLEDRYGITVNIDGELRTVSKSDWMIDNLWRKCYLTSGDISKIETTALMCSTSDDTFVEIGDIKDESPDAETP